MQPVIGLSTRPRHIETSGGVLGVDFLQHSYRDSVARAGGVPLPLAPVDDEQIPSLMERIDGLVLTGGGDVSPLAYGSSAHESMYDINDERDAFEFALTLEARRRRMPVLAICRGLQVVNVALGGTLVEDIPSEVGSTDHVVRGDEVYHPHQWVTLEPGCAVATVVGSERLAVNSIHHQSVRDVAPGFRVVGTADDGVVEAIEPEDDDWPLLAVQWHPEYLSDAGDAASQALFEALVKTAATGG